MLIGKNLVQNKEWPEPKEYDRVYFEYVETDALESYGKTQKTDKGREDVKLNGVKWQGSKPVELKFSEREFATPEERDAFLNTLTADALNYIGSIYKEDEPVITMLQALGDGLDQWARNKLVGKNRLGKPQSEDEAKASMLKDLMRTGKFTEKQARRKIELVFAPIEDDEEVAAA